MANSRAANSASNHHAGTSHNSESPQGLKSWWATFKKKNKEAPPAEVEAPRGIFGVPLGESIKYANVAISLTNDEGGSFIYGYVPIVVAKCGVFLKEKATDVEGIFRLSGSAKRIKELQAQFDEPPRYGKGLDWAGYTVHDAANVLRRYLLQLPQPIVPLDFYEKSRDPLRNHQSQAVGEAEAPQVDLGDFNHDIAIATYQQLITELPPLNRQLLLYILDLLSVFASKSDLNRMTSANLAAIFQPGMLSHPDHDMSPPEYRLSQDVLIFLIDNQDSFLIGMSGTAADEETVRDVQSGAPTPQETTPTRNTGLGRSASSASAGTDSLRRLGGNIRRNLSISSKHSHASSNVHAPNTPSPGTNSASGGGVHRSNTVPSKKSPALPPTARMNRGTDSPTTPMALSPALVSFSARSSSPGTKFAPLPSTSETTAYPFSASTTPTIEQPPNLEVPSALQGTVRDQSKERLLPNEDISKQIPSDSSPQMVTAGTSGKNRRVPALLTKSPTSDLTKEPRQPNKLRKKRMPSSAQPSASSSTNSLSHAEDSPRIGASFTLAANPGLGLQGTDDAVASAGHPTVSNTTATPVTQEGPQPGSDNNDLVDLSSLQQSQQPSESTLKPKSSGNSVRSKTSITDNSEQEQTEGAKAEKTEKKRTWRFSSRKNDQPPPQQVASPPLIGLNKPAGVSSGSVGSWQKTRKSVSNDIPPTTLEDQPSVLNQTSTASEDGAPEESEKKGLFGRIKAKVTQSKEERDEKKAEKERARSPPRDSSERNASKISLAAIANESGPSRGRSIEGSTSQHGAGKHKEPFIPHVATS